MAEKILKGIIFPGLEDTYIVPEVDDTLSVPGASADAKVVGEALSGKQPVGNYVTSINGATPDENGNIEIEVGSGGSGGSGEATQSDWNVTDETDPAYIKNKPFGSDTITLLDVTFQDSLINDGTEWSGVCIVEDTTSNTLIVGDTYTVIYCGTEYICECFSYMDTPCVGNTALIGVASEVPFMIVRDMSGEAAYGVACWGLMLVDLPTDLTISGAYPCTIKSSGVKYLSNKYLDFMDVQEAAEILPEQTITYTIDSENTEIPEQSAFMCAYVSQNGSIDGNMDETFYTSLYDLTAGVEYTVRFDGVEYKSTAQDLSALAPSTFTINKYVGLGNLAMVNSGDDTGEPFVFLLLDAVYNGEPMLQASSGIYHTPDVESLDCVVGIDSSYSAVIKEEYLPEGYGSSTGPSLPTVTAADAGKFLRVTDEGIWAAVSIPNAEGVGF